MTLAPAARLGPYEIVAPLGAGGMGEVYRARDTRLGREVAIKVLPADVVSDSERLRRFEQEARAASALNHPNILTVHDVGREGETSYLVTELLDGESLRARLAAGALPWRTAVGIGVDVARGLAAAHAKGIVHRDLKPENLFVTGDGTVKILDFGLAKLTLPESGGIAEATTVAGMTATGVVMGTAGYMAPEQVRGTPADARSDLFALGCVMYEMLSGARAFRGPSAVETLNAILKEEPRPLGELRADLPATVIGIVERCLAKEPVRRFQSAADLAFALDTAGHLSGRAPLEAVGPAPPLAAKLWTRRLGWAATLLVLVLIAWLAGKRTAPGASSESSFQQLTFNQQSIFNARLAPDGATVVFSAALQGNTPEIFTVGPQFPAPRALGLRATHLLSVSSQGELAILTGARFIAHNLFVGTLARVPLAGGGPRDLLTEVREADWSPDGESLAIIRNVDGRDRLEFPIGNVLYETGGYLSDLRVSPAGDRIAFCGHPQRWDNRGGVAVVDLRGKRTLLAEGFSAMGGLAWSRQGDEVFFSAKEGSTPLRVLAVTLSGRRRVALESAGRLSVHDAGPQGRLVVTSDDMHRRLFARAAGESVERDLTWLDHSWSPDLSADGAKIVFSEQNSLARPNYSVCLRGTDGSPVVELGEGGWAALSPDDKWVLTFVPSSPPRAVLYPTGAGEPHSLKRGAIEAYGSARFFPDGHSVLLCGHEAGRPDRCFRQEIPAGEPRPVTREGTWNGFPSPDGRQILISTMQGPAILGLVDGEEHAILGATQRDEMFGWSNDGRFLLLAIEGEVPRRIERLEIASGRRELLMRIGPANLAGVTSVGTFVLARDGRSYAYSCRTDISYLFLAESADGSSRPSSSAPGS